MSREAHVRFCESVAVRSRRATRPPMESWFHTLKVELVQDQKYATRREAMAEIFEYMEVFYNRQRIHTTIGGFTPSEIEEAFLRREA